MHIINLLSTIAFLLSCIISLFTNDFEVDVNLNFTLSYCFDNYVRFNQVAIKYTSIINYGKKNSSTSKKQKKGNQMGSFGFFHFEIWLANQQRKDKMGSMVKFTSFFLLLLSF